MDTIKDIAVIVGVVAAVLGILVLAIPYINGGRWKAAVAAQDVTIKALESTVKAQGDKIKDWEAKDAAKTAKIKGMEAQITVLLQQRPSQELIVDMAKDLKKHHQDSMLVLHSIEDKVNA